MGKYTQRSQVAWISSESQSLVKARYKSKVIIEIFWNPNVHRNDLVDLTEMQILIQHDWDGAQDSAFLTSI